MEEKDTIPVEKALKKAKKVANTRTTKKLEKQIGSIPNTGDSVKEIRKIRKELSKVFKLKGASKKKTTEKEYEEIREKAFEEISKKLDLKEIRAGKGRSIEEADKELGIKLE
jgi:hypothetical protein